MIQQWLQGRELSYFRIGKKKCHWDSPPDSIREPALILMWHCFACFSSNKNIKVKSPSRQTQKKFGVGSKKGFWENLKVYSVCLIKMFLLKKKRSCCTLVGHCPWGSWKKPWQKKCRFTLSQGSRWHYSLWVNTGAQIWIRCCSSKGKGSKCLL